MVQEATIQPVVSFQIFIRDNKPKMNVCYPFLSQEQILCKLREQWKKLDDSKRQPYSKLVLTKKKTVKTTKVKVVKITRSRTPKVKETRTLKKRVEISRNNDDDDNFGFDNICDNSYTDNENELDSTSENSPFMRNKFAIESLNSGFCQALYKPTESVKKRSGGKTYGGSVFSLQKCVPRVRPESVDNSRTGILQTQSKNRRSIQGHVSFSAVQETMHDHNGYESKDEEFDEEVLCIESYTENQTDTRSGNTCRNQNTDVMVPRRIKLQQGGDRSLMLGFLDTPVSKYSPDVRVLRVAESTKQKLNGKTTDKMITVTSSESIPSRFSKRLRNQSPDDDVFGALCGRSLHAGSNVHLNKKPKMVSELCKKETFSVTNNASVGKKGQPFCSQSPTLSAKVKVQSCIRDSKNELADVRGDLCAKNGAFGNFKPEHKIDNSKADVNRNSLCGKSGTRLLDYRANECVSSRAITHRHKLLVFDSPQTTKSCLRSTGQTNGSYQGGLNSSSMKASQKVTSDFFEKDTYWKDGDRFWLSDEESDDEFGDRSSIDENDIDRKTPCHTGKKIVSADEANLKTNIRQKSENIKTDFFQRESKILKRNVDDSDEENDDEFDDKDGWYEDDTVHTGLCQTGKKMNAVVGAYTKKSTVEKWEQIPFDFCGKQSDNNRKYVDRRGENNREANGKGSLLKNNVDSNILCYRNKQNTYETYSKKNTLKEVEPTISHFPGKGNYNRSKNADKYKECDEERKEFHNVVSKYKKDVKNAPCTKSSDTSGRKYDLLPQKENNYYQANKITDSGAMYTNNTMEKSREVSKGKILDKCEQLKHVTTESMKKQVRDKRIVKQKKEMDVVDVKHKYSKAENGFLRKYPKSVRKQTDESKKQNQKKSVITRESTSLKEDHGENKVKWLSAFAADNYSGKKSCILPVSLEKETVHCESYLNNSGKKQYKHTEEFGGDQSPSRKETPNLDVRKFKFSSDLSRGSGIGLQRRLFPEVDCRKMSSKMDCRNTSNMDYRKNYKINCRNISTTDCRNSSNIDCKNTSNIDCKNTSNIDCKNTSNAHCRNTSNIDCRTNYKMAQRNISTTDCRNTSNIDCKNTSNTDCRNTSNTDCKNTSNIDFRTNYKMDQRNISTTDCRNSSNIDCRNTSNIDCRTNYKMDQRNISTMDCRNTSNIDCKNTSNTDCRNTSNTDCKNTSNIDFRTNYKMDQRNISTMDCRNSSNLDCRNTSNIDCKNTSNTDCRNTYNTDCKNTSNIDFRTNYKMDQRNISTMDCRNSSNIDCRNNSNIDCRTNYKMAHRNISTKARRNQSQISGKAEVCNSEAESETSDKSLGSETDKDEEKSQDDFLVNMAGQTTSALLQAIDRLKSLTSPPMNLTDKCVPNGDPSDLPEPRNKDLVPVLTQPKFLCSMFEDITHNVNRAYLTPSKPRLLASSVIETPSNFMVMFDDGDVFL